MACDAKKVADIVSPPSILPLLIRAIHRRAVGSQASLGILPKDWKVQLLADLGSTEPPWPCGIAAECTGDILSWQSLKYSIRDLSEWDHDYNRMNMATIVKASRTSKTRPLFITP